MLYSTNIEDLATPVATVQAKNIKRKAPAAPAAPTPPTTAEGSISDAVDDAVQTDEATAKEAKVAAQKAARALKARQARAAKKAATQTPAPPAVPATPPPAPKKTRKLDSSVEHTPQSTPTPAPKKARKGKAPIKLDLADKVPKLANSEDEPPAWFKSFLANTRVEEAKISQPKKAQRTVRKEAAVEAGQKWKEPQVRDQINNQQDKHMASMHKLYQQIFRRS